MHRTSGWMSASHSSTRGRRTFSELTFQVATRIPATVPTRRRDRHLVQVVGAAAFLRVRLAGAAGSSTGAAGSTTTGAADLAARLRGLGVGSAGAASVSGAARLADRRAGLGDAGSAGGGASTTASGVSTTAFAALRDR